jgi:hypothetical protein
LGDAVSALTRQLTAVETVSQLLADTVAGNTQAVAQNTAAQGGRSLAGEIGRTASSVLGGALTLSPLISGIASLFGGGKAEPPPPLVRFALPPAVRIDAAIPGGQGGALTQVDHDQFGSPRSFAPPQPAPAPPAQTSLPAATQVTVQVQTLDSRSFLDHSDQIARAVREAMLNSHALNDLISDL